MRTQLAATAIALLVASGLQAAHHEATETLAERLASPERPQEDRARDAGRKPAEVLSFLGIEPGMTVIDLIAAGGYYTEVLSIAVGSSGRVYAQNPEFVLRFREGRNDKALTARLAGDRLPNVVRLDQEISQVALEPGSIDAAITALNYHDIHNRSGPEAAAAFLRAVWGLLKPGAVLGIVDHSGGVGDDEELHRIDQRVVEQAALAAGYEIAGRSDVLRNPEDDRTGSVFAPGLRGRTDRFVLKLRKP